MCDGKYVESGLCARDCLWPHRPCDPKFLSNLVHVGGWTLLDISVRSNDGTETERARNASGWGAHEKASDATVLKTVRVSGM